MNDIHGKVEDQMMGFGASRGFANRSHNVAFCNIDIYIHHGENFMIEKSERKRYRYNKVKVWEDCDEDTLDVFIFEKFVEHLGYMNLKNVFWYNPVVAKMNEGQINVYYEHAMEEVDLEVMLKNVEEGAVDETTNVEGVG
ncbi:hypothetical protein VNO77_13960 [Canavalia gladiata]|uniref:PB1-like domain-containing protein n=1 Tax=Canavalia gladiata TaxID=3824 RepID=A0AAN9M2Z3_CANGL